MEAINKIFNIFVSNIFGEGNEIILFFFIILTSILAFSLLFSQSRKFATFQKNTPQLLVSIGILGTFLGIFISLIDFNVRNIEDSIEPLINGLKIAFVTSIVGMFYALFYRVYKSILPTKIIEQGATAEDLLLKLSEIRDSISGDQDSSLFTQIQKLRTDTSDNLKDLNKSFKEFAEKMAENNTKALIEAIEKVMKDFNTKINEQIGDNFKRLNEGVENLVVW